MRILQECGQRWWRPKSWTRVVDHPYKEILVKNELQSYFKSAKRRVLNIRKRKFPGGFAIGPIMFIHKERKK